MRRQIPDVIWDDLVEHRWIADFRNEGNWADLFKEAHRLVTLRDRILSARAPRRTPAAARGTTIEARGRAWGAWAARFARGDMFVGGGDPWLAHVRGYLGGAFGPGDAIAHLRSVAWMLVPVSELVARRPPGRLSPKDAPRIRGTTARLVSETDGTVDGSPGVHVELEVTFGTEVRQLTVWHPARARSVSVEIPSGTPVRTIAAVGTLNERLLGLASQAQWGPLTVPQMLWLILTDEPPEIRPLAVGVRYELGPDARFRDIITIEAEPWVPVHAVAAAYREVQAERLSGPNRPPRERSLELARFLAAEGWSLSVRERMRVWNQLHPLWAVDDARNFQKSSRRAIALLFGEQAVATDRPGIHPLRPKGIHNAGRVMSGSSSRPRR